MAKGTAIVLAHGSDENAAVKAVRAKYSAQRGTAAGWHGTAVVNIKADDNGEGARTLIIKGLKDGFEVYGLLGRVEDKVTTKAGTFKPA